MVLYKNIIQSSSTACIPELQLAFIFPITRSTSTAYEGNTESKQRLQTIVSHWTSCCTMNNSTESECSRPWHFICQAEPNFDGNYRTKVGLPDADKHTCFINNKKNKSGTGRKWSTHRQKQRGWRVGGLPVCFVDSCMLGKCNNMWIFLSYRAKKKGSQCCALWEQLKSL